MSKKRKLFKMLLTIIIFLSFVLVSFIYISYFYYIEGRNSIQNDNAHNIQILTKHYIEDNSSKINSDVSLSNNKKYESNNNDNIDIETILKNYSKNENLVFDDGCYYIEVRNKDVYKVIYAKWPYSGYVGTSPISNNECKIYENEVKEAVKEFNKYLNSK